MSEDFRYKPGGDWFSFAKVRKLCFLCSCKQSVKVFQKVFITFEIWIFFLQKCTNSLQEAFIHAPEPCEARFIMDARTLFDVFWTVEQNHCNDNAWNSQDNFLYNSDWIRLKEESHIHLGCLEGE